MRQFCTIAHFQIASSLCFKARPSSKPLIWKLLFILTQIKLVLTTKNFHLVSFLKWGFFKLGNGLLNYLVVEEQLSTCCSFEKKKKLFSFQFSTLFPSVENWFANFKTFFPEFNTRYKPWPSESNLQETSNCSYLENISYDIYLFYFRGYLLFQPGREGGLSSKLSQGKDEKAVIHLIF